MRSLAIFALLFITSKPCFSLDLANYRKELSGLGLSVPVPAQETFPAAVVSPYAGGYGLAPGPISETQSDPDKFIDEHSPEEVGAAYGLSVSRFLITDPDRIREAALRLTVDLARQRLVVRSSATTAEFKISSGLLPEHATPGSGNCYAPDFLETMHHSSLYNNAPMPNAVFFNGNIAIHGTNAEALLGRPASHGCVRLSKADSKTVFGLVRASGKANTVICVKGVTPGKQPD